MQALPTLGSLLVLTSLLHSTISARNWTPQQHAVLDRLDECVQAGLDRNRTVELSCFHRDFSGWRNDMPSLRDGPFVLDEIERSYSEPQSETLVDFSIQPLDVDIYGSIAIIHHYGYYYMRPEGGETVMRRSRWTDIMLNEGGRWAWIADHGGTDPGNPVTPAN